MPPNERSTAVADCAAELCHNWTGQGCACEFLGLDPVVVCGRCGVRLDAWAGCPNCNPAPEEDGFCRRCERDCGGDLDAAGICGDCRSAERDDDDEL